MWSPKARRTRTVLVVLGVIGALVIGGVLGGAIVGVSLFSTGGSAQVGANAGAPEAVRSSEQLYSGATGAPVADMATGGESAAKTLDAAAENVSAVTGPMMVKTATIDLRVDKVANGIDDIRRVINRHDAQISDFSVSNSDVVEPLARTDEFAAPSTAYVTIRVPSKNLDALRADIAGIGEVLTESSSASDVTQEYVDMAARLKNLKAEEVRLRDFLTKTNKVSELLQVESELSRVRGEIESMQAQLDYLNKQVELSTLTVTLSEPGAVVRPQGIDWGFREALTRGFQGAAGVVTFLISASIAVLPLVLVGLLVFVVVRAFTRRARHSRPAEPEPDDSAAPASPAEAPTAAPIEGDE